MRPSRTGWIGGVLLLFLAAARPLTLFAANLTGVGHPERLVVFTFTVWGGGLLLWWALTRIGYRVGSALYVTSVCVVLFMYGGRLINELGALLGMVLIVVAVSAIAFLARNLTGGVLINAILAGLVVALGSAPVTTFQQSLQDWGEDSVQTPPPIEVTLHEKPDLFIVVFDGYPGMAADALEDLPVDREHLDELRQRGFQIPQSAWSAYWETDKSIPSILELSYPVTSPLVGNASKRSLYQIVGGDNALTRILDHNGYATLMVESGWSGSRCASYDTCVSSALLDEAMFLLLRNTLAGPGVLQTQGYAFTVGSQTTMEWLAGNAEELSRSPEPDFVFAHVMAPHPPFFLDESCQTVVDRRRTGIQFNLSRTGEDERERYFLEQRACVDGFMRRMAAIVEEDDVVVFVADHGTDRRGQTTRPAIEWNRDAKIERMNVFAAVRTGRECDLPDPVIAPNLIRTIVSCLSAEPLAPLPNRMWVNDMVELSSSEVRELMEWGAAATAP